MLKTIRIWLGGLMMCALGVGALPAATIVVDGAGTGDYTTIQAAVDASSSYDTIQVKTGTYTEKVTFPADRDLTLEAVAGAAVTISAPEDKAVVVDGGFNNVIIRGESDDNRIVLVGKNTSAIETGYISGNLLMDCVEFSGVTNGWGSVFRTATTTATITLNHCLWSTEKGSSGGWTVCCVEGLGQFEVNDSVFMASGRMNALRSWVWGENAIVVNRTTFEGYDAGDANFFMSNDPVCVFSSDMNDAVQGYVFNDCKFNGYNWIYTCGAAEFTAAEGANKTITLVNPELGLLHDHDTEQLTRIWGAASTNCAENIIIKGTDVQNKCDLTQSSFFGYLVNMIEGGSLTIEDCILRNGAWSGVGFNVAGDSANDGAISVSRCLFPGQGSIKCYEQSAVDNGAEFTVDINNSIVQYNGEMFDFHTHDSPVAMSLAHTTFVGVDDGTVPEDPYVVALDSLDSITADYCIFDEGDSTVSKFANAVLGGKVNVAYKASGSGFNSVPADTILADPLLLSTGEILSASSPAVDAATGSTETVDYFGDARNVADIGADEYYRINAVRNGIWTLY